MPAFDSPMFRDLTSPAVYMGLLAAFVGYSASFAIVLAGLNAMGATEEQAATGLFFATLGMGVCSIWLPIATRTPAAVAWSTPGAAFLASVPAPAGGFAEAAGALICCAVLILVTGLIPAVGRVVGAIPKPIANALLAGVLLKLCFAPALAIGAVPLLFLPVFGAWLLGLYLNRLAAMPLAVVAFAIVLFWITAQSPGAANGLAGMQLPSIMPVSPVLSWQSVISLAIPLYLVTMAGQNIPGFAVLELNGYAVNRQSLLRNTGLVSALIAPFGAIPVNMSAITAAMMCGEDAGKDPARRYWAAITSGIAYMALAVFAGVIAGVAGLAPPVLITGIAGLALIPALVASLSGTFAEPGRMEAPALTFLVAASGMTLFGISGAFWGLIAGGVAWWLKRAKH